MGGEKDMWARIAQATAETVESLRQSAAETTESLRQSAAETAAQNVRSAEYFVEEEKKKAGRQ